MSGGFGGRAVGRAEADDQFAVVGKVILIKFEARDDFEIWWKEIEDLGVQMEADKATSGDERGEKDKRNARKSHWGFR